MSNFLYLSPNLTHIGVVSFPDTRRIFNVGSMAILARQALATDSIGVTTVTFSGVHANSEIRVFYPDTTEAAGIEVCVDNQVLTWDVFDIGNPNNTVIIRIINELYKIKEFSYIASQGAVSIPIQQEIDKWFNNPI